MARWTTSADVTARWVGSGAPTDEELVEALLQDAETVILSEFPRIQERIDDLSLNEATVRLVTVRMVMRVLRNPENLTYWQQTTGPFGQARNFGTGGSDIWLTDEEKDLLSPSKRGKAFSVDVAPNKTNARFIIDVPETDQPIFVMESDF